MFLRPETCCSNLTLVHIYHLAYDNLTRICICINQSIYELIGDAMHRFAKILYFQESVINIKCMFTVINITIWGSNQNQ